MKHLSHRGEIQMEWSLENDDLNPRVLGQLQRLPGF